MIKILTKVSGVCASAIAHPDPVTPTQILFNLLRKFYPQNRLESPTDSPTENKLYALNSALL
jgi:hypothetical protein